MNELGKALMFAQKAHAGQLDKGGNPYIFHVARVADRVESEEGKIVALLHDTIEDTDVTFEDLLIEFGASVAYAVFALTRKKGESPELYYEYIKNHHSWVREVKLADIADNIDESRLSVLDKATQDRLKLKYGKALALLA